MSLFTEVAAMRREYCDRGDCRKAINPGELRFTIADQAGNSKLVCSDCKDHYREKARKLALEKGFKTSTRNVMTEDRYSSSPQLDFQQMRQSVNEAQRKGGNAPGGRVTALPAPNVSVANYAVTGYSSNHDQHAQQTSLWSSRAYRGFKAGQIGSIKINVSLYKPSFGAKGQPIAVDGYREGIRVSSDIGSRDLSQKIRDVMRRHILEFCGRVPVDIEKMVIRDASNGGWIELERFSELSYFGDQFLKPNPRKKDGTLMFSAPTKPLAFGLVFEKDVWRKLELAWDQDMYEDESEPTVISHTPSQQAHSSIASTRRGSKRKAPQSHLRSAPKIARNSQNLRSAARETSPTSGNESDDLEYVERHETSHTIRQSQTGQEDSESESEGGADAKDHDEHEEEKSNAGGESDEDSEGSEEQIESIAKSVINSRVPVFRSTTSVSTLSRLAPGAAPTSSGKSTTINRSFASFNFKTIQKGFVEGGMNTNPRLSTYDSDSFIHESISFIPLPQPSFEELMEKPTKLREDMLGPEAEVFSAQLRYDARPQSFLGTGSFKTASLAHLTFIGEHIPTTGLGLLLRKSKNGTGHATAVALKRPFRNKTGNGVSRMTLNKEQVAVFDECKLLVWARALLAATYDFIDNFKSDSGPSPFDILQFRFVKGGMALAQKSLDATTKGSNPTTTRAVYILEEVLPRSDTDFVKYLHNANAFSDISPDAPDYYLVEFLVFIQHTQYMITEGVAYVSDFQGVGLTLTDPQILTTPHLGDDLFGSGNLGEAFERFHIEHQCNKYCKWFELEDPAETRKKLHENLKNQGIKLKKVRERTKKA